MGPQYQFIQGLFSKGLWVITTVRWNAFHSAPQEAHRSISMAPFTFNAQPLMWAPCFSYPDTSDRSHNSPCGFMTVTWPCPWRSRSTTHMSTMGPRLVKVSITPTYEPWSLLSTLSCRRNGARKLRIIVKWFPQRFNRSCKQNKTADWQQSDDSRLFPYTTSFIPDKKVLLFRGKFCFADAPVPRAEQNFRKSVFYDIINANTSLTLLSGVGCNIFGSFWFPIKNTHSKQPTKRTIFFKGRGAGSCFMNVT